MIKLLFYGMNNGRINIFLILINSIGLVQFGKLVKKKIF